MNADGYNGHFEVESKPGEVTTYTLTAHGLTVKRRGHSSKQISFEDLLALAEKQETFQFGAKV